MMWPQMQTVAELAISRVLNSLPEGLLIALLAWALLRLLPRQNSGTRFAVWFVALLTVAGLPFIAETTSAPSFAAEGVRSMINVPSRWGLLLFLVWVLAASVAMLRLATGLWRLRKLRKSCVAIDITALDPVVRKTMADFSASRSVELTMSERVNVPAAIGFFKPMIVVPAWALRELSPEELSIILLHEFAHLRRWDDWTNLLQKLVRAIFLFHPAVWWIESRLSLEREMACDDLVLADTANPRGYAKCLIALLERSVSRRGLAMAQAAVDRAREASLRLAQILDVRRSNTRHVWKPALGCVGVFSLICLGTVSRAPQFVAFEQNPQTIRSSAVNLPTVSQSFAPVVIPAGLHTSSAPPLKRMPESRGAWLTARVAKHSAPAPLAQPNSPVESERSQVHAVSAVANEPVVLKSETLLLIRTTQRTGPDSWTWSVYVYRVIWTNSAQDGAEKAPMAHKT